MINRAISIFAALVAWHCAAGFVAAGNAPDGMVWIPTGEFRMGSDDPHFPDAQPIHLVWVDGFWIDKTDVTNEAFRKFVNATGYVTVAQRTPKAEDFPGVPQEKLVPGSICFVPPDHPVSLDDISQWWRLVPGADWRHPEGPGSDINGKEKHPVVHVAYEDALAYAKWAGKRLPTEAEWEYAARGRLDQNKFVWGNDFKPGGKFMANTFQGHFPDKNTAEDGFAGTSPVGSFPTNGFGLYDMAGNVWQWTSDWYRPDTFQIDARSGELSVNPQGPAEKDSWDPQEPGVKKRVLKGGSFLCTDQYCSRYMPGARGQGEPSTGTNHLGFRCVMTPPPP